MDLKAAGMFIMLCIPFLIMTVWAVVNAAEKDFDSVKQKAIWLIIAAIPFVGFLIYFPFGARKGRKPGQD
jgi:hypothetical protein